MPKHRGSVYTVVREVFQRTDNDTQYGIYEFSAVIGVYATLQRAEEVCGTSAQALRDAGAADGDYKFTTQVSTYYDE